MSNTSDQGREIQALRERISALTAEFLGLVSHELRAPLVAILGSAVVLLEDSAELDPAERHEFYRIIREQAAHMRGLIGDLLDAVSVADGGKGIAPEALAHLFRKYTGDGDGRAIESTGLGLVICGGLVEAHGGRIRAESGGAGQGARFTFTVPVAGEAGQGASAEPRPSGPVPQMRESPRVLVVDDDPQTLRFVRDALTQAGYTALVTGDHAELSPIIRVEAPDLVLLDLMLPGADGIELMRSVPELDDVPVVFISAYGRDEIVAEALQAGAADYLVKPFSATELAARVGAALRRRAAPEPFSHGALAIHYEQRRVTVAGREVELTSTEYDLLRVLSLEPGRVVTYDALLRRVWGGRAKSNADLVRNFVKKLRAKLGEDARRPTWIFNGRGVGYRMARPGDG